MINYQEVETFDIPQDAFSFDTLNDGRLVACGVNEIWVETDSGSRSFQAAPSPDFGNPAFMRVSPLGKLICIGSYEDSVVHVFPFPCLLYTSPSPRD